VRNIVEAAFAKAKALLSGNLDKLHGLAEALLEREILDSDEVIQILNGQKLAPLPEPDSGANGRPAEDTRGPASDGRPASQRAGGEPVEGPVPLPEEDRGIPVERFAPPGEGREAAGDAAEGRP
jgi:cell division protease FtsH